MSIMFHLPLRLFTSETGGCSSPASLGGKVDNPSMELSSPSLSVPFTVDVTGNVANGKSGLNSCKLCDSGSPNLL